MKITLIIQAQTSDMMICRSSGRILATNNLGLHLGSQFLSRTRDSSLECTNPHIQGLSLYHLKPIYEHVINSLLFFFLCVCMCECLCVLLKNPHTHTHTKKNPHMSKVCCSQLKKIADDDRTCILHVLILW